MKHILTLLAAVLLMVSCGGKKLPEGVLAHDSMVPLLVDVYLLEAYYAVETNYNYDSLSPEMMRAYDDVLARHGVTLDDFETSLAYYSEHPELYSAINREVAARLETKAEKNAEETKVKPVKLDLIEVK